MAVKPYVMGICAMFHPLLFFPRKAKPPTWLPFLEHDKASTTQKGAARGLPARRTEAAWLDHLDNRYPNTPKLGREGAAWGLRAGFRLQKRSGNEFNFGYNCSVY